MILRELGNLIDFRFLHVCVQTTWNLVFEIWEIVEKIKLDIDRLLLVTKMKKSSILTKYTEKLFYIIKTKILSSLPFLKLWKHRFMYFRHKHVETGLNCSHEVSIFLKYHMSICQSYLKLKKCSISFQGSLFE